MAGTRASYQDRDRALDLIEAAYVDGRLTSDERETRTGEALSAVTRSELDGLVVDLGGGVPASRSPATLIAAVFGATRRAISIPIIVGLIVLVVVMASVIAIRSTPTPEINSVLSAPAQQSTGSYLTEDGFAALVDAVQTKFGTTQIAAAIVDPGYAVFAIARADKSNTVDLWNYRGSFEDAAKTATLGTNEVLVDLRMVSATALVDLVAAGKASTGTVPLDQSYVRISGSTGAPTMTIHVTDTGGKTYELVRGFDGKQLPNP